MLLSILNTGDNEANYPNGLLVKGGVPPYTFTKWDDSLLGVFESSGVITGDGLGGVFVRLPENVSNDSLGYLTIKVTDAAGQIGQINIEFRVNLANNGWDMLAYDWQYNNWT